MPAVVLTACSQAEPSRSEFALGTVCTITLFEQAENSVYNKIFASIREIDNLMSVNIPGSDVSKINSAEAAEPVKVNKNVFTVIEQSIYFSSISGGAFDITVGPIVSLWGIGSESHRIPSREEIASALSLIDWNNIELNSEAQNVFLRIPGMKIDLGAIAKGYAADMAAKTAIDEKIERAIIDLGGNIVIIGERKDKAPWRVGIQNPNENRGNYLGILHIQGDTSPVSIVTSSINERYFEEDGRRYHHIFSPFTGYPAENELLSVTIISHNSMNADALSTAVFVLGYEKGVALIDYFPGTEAVFVFRDNSIKKTAGANLTLTDNSFRLIF